MSGSCDPDYWSPDRFETYISNALFGRGSYTPGEVAAGFEAWRQDRQRARKAERERDEARNLAREMTQEAQSLYLCEGAVDLPYDLAEAGEQVRNWADEATGSTNQDLQKEEEG